MKLFVPLIAIAITTGCTFSQAEESKLEDTSWRLRAHSLGDIWREVPDDAEITLSFSGDGFAGSTGCNQYFGTPKIKGNWITFGQTGMSFSLCADPILQEEEDLFLEQLEGVRSFEIAEDTLFLNIGDGQTSMVFDRSLAKP